MLHETSARLKSAASEASAVLLLLPILTYPADLHHCPFAEPAVSKPRLLDAASWHTQVQIHQTWLATMTIIRFCVLQHTLLCNFLMSICYVLCDTFCLQLLNSMLSSIIPTTTMPTPAANSPVTLECGSLASVCVGDPYPGQVPGCMGPFPIMPHLHLHTLPHVGTHS